jgi:hypothetical protein
MNVALEIRHFLNIHGCMAVLTFSEHTGISVLMFCNVQNPNLKINFRHEIKNATFCACF